MLSFHVGLYLISATALLSWNVLTSPGDMWTENLFRRWGAVLIFHAIALAAGRTVWRLMQTGGDEHSVPPARPIAASSQPAAPAPMERWFVPRANPEPVTAVRRPESALDSWRGGVARRTRGVVGSASNAWSSLWPSSQPGPGRRDGAAAWPVNDNANRADDVQFVSRFTPPGDPAARPPVPGSGLPPDLVLDVDGVRVRGERAAANGTGPTLNGAAGARRNWVEEATRLHLPTTGEPLAPSDRHAAGETPSPSPAADSDDAHPAAQ